jgi:ribosomal protein S18 acetylase RimI-like enzyme
MDIAPMDEMIDSSYAGPDDLERMKAMLVSAWSAGSGSAFWHVGDLVWRYFLLTIGYQAAPNIRLWSDADGVLGFAWFDPREQSFDVQLHPRGRGARAEEAMLDWVEQRWRRLAEEHPSAPARPPWTGCCEDDAWRQSLLERRGYHRGAMYYHHLYRSLEDALPEAPLPAGFAARCVTGEGEHRARAACHRSAFHPSRVTDAHYLRLMRLPGYDRELDVVVTAPGGQVASFALAWADPVNRVAEFEPVGTHADFRRRGLGKAALAEGMRRMRARGMRAAFVMCEGDSAAAVRLYESAGFRSARRDYDYARD